MTVGLVALLVRIWLRNDDVASYAWRSHGSSLRPVVQLVFVARLWKDRW